MPSLAEIDKIPGLHSKESSGCHILAIITGMASLNSIEISFVDLDAPLVLLLNAGLVIRHGSERRFSD